MDSMTEAAVAGGTATLVLALTIAGAVITLLLAVLVFFVRDKIRQRKQYEDNLEKRLSGGTETMKELAQSIASLRISIESVQREYVDRLSKLVTAERFDAYCRDHDRIHDRLEGRLVDLTDQHSALVQRVELGIKGMSNSLAKLVEWKMTEAENET